MPAPVLSVAQMREWEAATWAAGITEESVIQRVGALVAHAAQKLTLPGDFILLLAGKGHNGDDVRLSLPHYVGRPVRLLNVSDPTAALEDIRLILKTQSPALIVDGLFGIGLNRPLTGAWRELIEAVNASGVRVLAVDVPSGLDAGTGTVAAGGVAIRAAVTLTVGAAKTGLLTRPAAGYVGRLEVAPEIGLVSCPVKSELQWTLAEDFKGLPPARPADGHKGTFGHVVILAGSTGFHGAAVLAARGAMRARPGLITVVTQSDVYGPVASQLESAMVHAWNAGWSLPTSCTAIVAGPGLAAPDLPMAFREQIIRLWREAAMPMVVDASALAWLPEGPVNPGATRVITPHPGEAGRLLGAGSKAIEADRIQSLRSLSQKYGRSMVVLKGSHTLVGSEVGEIYVNSSGNPGLAQGGAGDLLAGFLGGLLAQPAMQRDVARTVRYGVWMHGNAADRLESVRQNWTVEELARELGA